ncbi:MAG: ArsR/SmtB family transcription factor [Pseudomonas sp.]
MRLHTEPDLARVAGLMGEPTRAAMLASLLGGQALAAGELARRAGVTAATASAHLARLLESGLLTCRRSGRHRYYELANGDVAAALEALARVAAPVAAGNPAQAKGSGELRFARTCYDHLAGKLGLLLTETMLERGLICGRTGFELTTAGDAWLVTLGIDVQALRTTRRILARPCMDWSERRNHLAGAAGAAIANALLERGWLARLPGTRALRLSLRGREGLYRSLGLEIVDPATPLRKLG